MTYWSLLTHTHGILVAPNVALLHLMAPTGHINPGQLEVWQAAAVRHVYSTTAIMDGSTRVALM